MEMQLSLSDEPEEYKAFVDKFKPKKTTDDCYTPPAIYDWLESMAGEPVQLALDFCNTKGERQ